MRLIEVKNKEVQQFFDGIKRPYAILSHTWEHGEPDHKNVVDGVAEEKAGYRKIRLAAEEAKLRNIDYLWVDTICIDKTNSVELSEAINSMYRWYEEALICYVYLPDVHSSKDLEAFKKSRWFTRGWTLQELLAPPEVAFFTASWQYIGRRSDPELRQAILDGCKIENPDRELFTSFRREEWSVAERMSWASHRETTRAEDLAYCLLGIFGVHMPLLYGEAERAFIRLQEEIMRMSDDRSIFAWIDPALAPGSMSGLLARHPSAFADASEWHHLDRWSSTSDQYTFHGDPHRMTSKGVHLQLPLYWCSELFVGDEYHGMLGSRQDMPGPAIRLKRLGDNEFARIDGNRFATTTQMRQYDTEAGRASSRRWNLRFDSLEARIHRAYAYPHAMTVKQRLPVLRSDEITDLTMFLLPDKSTAQKVLLGIEPLAVAPASCWQRNQNAVQFKNPEQTLRIDFKASRLNQTSFQFAVELSNDGGCALRFPGDTASPTFSRYTIDPDSGYRTYADFDSHEHSFISISSDPTSTDGLINRKVRFRRLRVSVKEESLGRVGDEGLASTCLMAAMTIAAFTPLITGLQRHHRGVSKAIIVLAQMLGPAFGLLIWIWINYRFRIAPGSKIFRLLLRQTLLRPFISTVDRTMLSFERFIRLLLDASS